NTVQTKFFVDTDNVKQQSLSDAVKPVAQQSQTLKLNLNTNKEAFKTVSAQEFKETYLDNTNMVRSDSSFTPYIPSNPQTGYSNKKTNIFIPYEDIAAESADTKKDTVQPEPTKATAEAPLQSACTQTDTKSDKPQNVTVSDDDFIYDIKVIGEVFNTYILCQSQDSLIVIDKHAAHERLLYERLKKAQNTDNQMLLAPVGVNLSAKEKEAVINNLSLLENQGFIVEDMGLNGIIVRAVPLNISCDDPQSLIEEIAYNLAEGDGSTMTEKQEWIMHSVACRSAIKAGDKATEYELKCLINDIKTEKIPMYCPHGRPVIISITKKEIERQFGRA
ncbi:MAG: hypothetical protein IKV52_04040, partial [Oscillospiraceae bacterium]|nr:hypothetical protein [Oscillospiraceae bacterium]